MKPTRAVQLTHRISLGLVCLAIAAYGVLTAMITPVSARLHYDPSLQYMLSSLAWFRGATYDYIDHPGTPVEVLGTVLLALSYPLAGFSSEGFIAYHLTHVQQFLSLAQTLLVVASVTACVFVAGRSICIAHWSQALVGTALAALFFALLPDALPSLALWSHESFCFPAGTLLSLLVLLAVRRAGRPSRTTLVGLGFASGVLTSVQLYFAAWVVGAAVALSVATRLSGAGWRQSAVRGAVVVVMAGLGFFVATLPILTRYHQLAGWIWLLISHQGTYGAGPLGAPSADVLSANLSNLVQEAPALFYASGAAVLVLALRLLLVRNRQAGVPAAGLGFVAQLLVLLLLVAKHPGVRYLLPIAATLPVIFATALDGLDPRRAVTRWALTALSLGVLAGFGAQLVSAATSHLAVADQLRRDDQATDQMLAQLAATRSIPRTSLRTLWTYGTTAPCYALWFGDDSADRVFQADIEQMCPRDANLNVWNAKVLSPAGDVNFGEYREWDVVVLPEADARLRPALRTDGPAFPSSIGSLGGGQLLFVARN